MGFAYSWTRNPASPGRPLSLEGGDAVGVQAYLLAQV